MWCMPEVDVKLRVKKDQEEGKRSGRGRGSKDGGRSLKDRGGGGRKEV